MDLSLKDKMLNASIFLQNIWLAKNSNYMIMH